MAKIIREKHWAKGKMRVKGRLPVWAAPGGSHPGAARQKQPTAPNHAEKVC